MKPRILLLDADIIAYKWAATAQRSYAFPWDSEEEIPAIAIDDLDEVCKRVDEWIEFTQERLEAERVIVCLSDPDRNFRKEIYPQYKQQRQGVVKPVLLAALKEHLADNYGSYIRPGLEADDVMGILATSKVLQEYTAIIVSSDKDMRQIPGLLFNPDKDEDAVRITKESGEYWFYTQVLTGDTVDGYPGCPGIGPKKAEKILIEADDYWESVLDAYLNAGLSEQEALIQARCARILQASDYDFKTKKYVPWTPSIKPSLTETK